MKWWDILKTTWDPNNPGKLTNIPMQQQQQPSQYQYQQPPQQPMGGTGVQDPTGGGGGNIGVGQAPIPGEQGFSGNVGQQQQGVEQTQTNVEQSPTMGSVQ